ncbi:hypothetical protein K435DRAFT_794542 [Dendrothele bispora CBS 962.96]|uniref:C2H2-type domain-containing protein n=1 Tax=Dendrothele bispora (strain CBS 962.96) TaxID=1314807 RepID=A0A4V4HGS5_DENBC|nr:hypothetical protein K435DRAFT_794542 [Dendrothele bispora CBS 962.96]
MPRSRSILTENAHLTTWAEIILTYVLATFVRVWAEINHRNSSFLSSTSLNLCIPGTNDPVSMDYTEAVADPPMYCETQLPPPSQPATFLPPTNELECIGLASGSYPAFTMYHQNEEMDIATTDSFVSEMLLPTDSPFDFSNAGEFSHPSGRTEAELHPTNREDEPTHSSVSNNTVASSVDPNPSVIMVEEFTGNSHVEIHGARAQPQSSRVATDRLLMVSRQRRKHPGKYICELPGCGQDFTAVHNLRNHLRSHEKLKKFLCGKCKKTFSTKSVLNRHVSTIHSKEKYQK